MSRVYKLLSTTARPSVTQVKPRPRILQRPFARNAPTRPKATELACAMCLNNSRKFRARVRFALGGTALFIRTSLEKTGLWHPLLNLLSSSVGVTAAKLIDGVAVLTACFLMLEAGLLMLQAHDIPHDAESESSNESVASDPSVNLVENLVIHSPRYDAHAPPISLAYLRSALNPFGMPFLNFSSAHRDAVARAVHSSGSPAGSELRDGLSGVGGGSEFSAGANIFGGEDDTAILQAVLAASLI